MFLCEFKVTTKKHIHLIGFYEIPYQAMTAYKV